MGRSRPHIRQAAAVALVCFAGAVAAVWAAPRVSEAVAAWLRDPPVQARTLSLARLAAAPVSEAQAGARPVAAGVRNGGGGPPPGATAPVTLDPGMRFTMIGFTCGPVPAGTSVVWLRARAGDGAWGPWHSAELERVGVGPRAARSFIEPVWTGPGRYVQVAAARPGASPRPLRDVRVVAIASDGDATAADSLLGVVRRVAAVVAGIRLTPPAEASTTTPPIVTRAEWGANESWRSGSPSYAPVEMAFIHHTDGGNGYTRAQAPGVVRGIYYYHTHTLGWSDIGYDFLVDRYGTIYEGRYGGVGKGVVGAQVLGFNTGSTGVAVMGTFTNVAPPAAAVAALERLLAWKLDVHHVDPLGTAVLTCGYGQKFATGQRVTFPAIAGHRQANYTDCPGDKLYALLPAIRRVVAATGLPKIYALTASPQDVSPNGDGVQDRTSLSFTLSGTASWTLTAYDASGAAVRTFTGAGSKAAVTWGGEDDAGQILPDGLYKVVARATTSDGRARAAVIFVSLDTVPPAVQSAAVSPDSFSPNGDGAADTASLRYTVAETCRSRIWVLDSSGAVVRKLTGWRGVGAGAHAVPWDGRASVDGGLAAAPDGRYVFRLVVRDAAGNVTSVDRGVAVDRTLGYLTVKPAVFSPNGDGVKDRTTFGFRLTRRADVTVQVSAGGSVVRTLFQGRLATGPHSVVWDGRLPDGTTGANGPYRCTVSARSDLGTMKVSAPLTVDCYRPRLGAPATASVTLGKTARIACTARDAYSTSVKVWGVVTGRAGATVATVSLGWVPQGRSVAWTWKPPSRKVYTVTFHAVDRGGNVQRSVARTLLTVK